GGKSKPAEPAAPAEPAVAEPAAPAEPAATVQAPATDDGGALAQAELAEQYEVGKKVYQEKKCASCHEDSGAGNKKNPPVIGEKALPEQPPKGAKLRKVPFKTAADVLGFVKAKMPPKAQGSLTDEEAAAVTSWILSENKANIEKKLDASNAASVNLR
ncbi:MAG: cytochrome c, partial [Kofleriaceae bacterium]|nr:cytochrome c [Kofleriaceae bacterium]